MTPPMFDRCFGCEFGDRDSQTKLHLGSRKVLATCGFKNGIIGRDRSEAELRKGASLWVIAQAAPHSRKMIPSLLPFTPGGLNRFLNHGLDPDHLMKEFESFARRGGPEERKGGDPRGFNALMGGAQVLPKMPNQMSGGTRAAIEIDLSLGNGANMDHA